MAYPLMNQRRKGSKMNNMAYKWLLEWVLLHEERDRWFFSSEVLVRSTPKIKRTITTKECGAMFRIMARENPHYFEVKWANKGRTSTGELPIMHDTKISSGHSMKVYRIRTEIEIQMLEEEE